MPKFTLQLTVIALILSFATTANGQSSDWYVTPSIVYTDDDGDRKLDDSLGGAQVSVGRDLTTHLSLEGMLGYSNIDGYYFRNGVFVRDSESHLDISANLLAYFERDRVFAPYVMVGVGYLGVSYNEGSDENRASGSLGLGFKWRMGDSNFAIRGEYRARLAYESDQNLVDNITTLGVQYNFGARSRSDSLTDQTTDTDGDGVFDIWDACPNTEAGVAVTSRGCPLAVRDADDDQDHISNSADQCPNTPLGVPVDSRGCSLDSDMDGVTTDKDRCPASRPGADVNSYGCESDEDNDGVLDQYDECPNTPAGARTDVKGCEIKDVISLPGVNFETGQDVLLPGTEYLLKTAADTLIKHRDLQIEVAGHSDNVGNEDQNIGLSMRRARTVQDFLIQYGVDEDRLTFKGYGEAQPIADNSTAEGRATNRRVELRLVTR